MHESYPKLSLTQGWASTAMYDENILFSYFTCKLDSPESPNLEHLACNNLPNFVNYVSVNGVWHRPCKTFILLSYSRASSTLFLLLLTYKELSLLLLPTPPSLEQTSLAPVPALKDMDMKGHKIYVLIPQKSWFFSISPFELDMKTYIPLNSWLFPGLSSFSFSFFFSLS